MNPSGMQVIVVSKPEQEHEQPTCRNMKPRLAKQLIGLGVIHMLSGVLCVISQSIALDNFVKVRGNDYVSEYFSLLATGYGFWSGLLFLITGIIGIAAGISKSSCQVIANNVFSIISAAFATILLIIAVTSAYVSFREREKCVNRRCTTEIYREITTILVMESMLAVVGLLEGIISICSSIVCCLIGLCSCFHAATPQTQTVILNGDQHAALMSNQMLVPNQQQHPTVGFYPQQQTVQYNKQQLNDQPFAFNKFRSATSVEGSYTCLNTGIIHNFSSSDVDSPDCLSTSAYESENVYLEIQDPYSSSP